MINLKEMDNNTKALFYIVITLAAIALIGTFLYNHFRNKMYTIKNVSYSIKSDYNFDNAKKDGYVVYLKNECYNEDKVDQFYNNVQNGIDSSITLISYNLEGFPLIDEFHFKNGKLILYMDYTRNPFANEIYKKKVISLKIKDIEIATNRYNKKYIKEK